MSFSTTENARRLKRNLGGRKCDNDYDDVDDDVESDNKIDKGFDDEDNDIDNGKKDDDRYSFDDDVVDDNDLIIL